MSTTDVKKIAVTMKNTTELIHSVKNNTQIAEFVALTPA